MGRAERRRTERKQRIYERQEKLLVSKDQLKRSKERLVDEANKYSTEYLMTCFALSLNHICNFDADQILNVLRHTDDLMGDILSDKKTMEDYIDELKEKTGIIVEV